MEDKPCANQSAESIQNFLKSLLQQQLQLSKAEKLMLINNPPTTPLEIQLVSILFQTCEIIIKIIYFYCDDVNMILIIVYFVGC